MIAFDPALAVESEYHLMVAGQFHGNQNLFIVLLQTGRTHFGRIDQLLGLISSDCHGIVFHFFVKMNQNVWVGIPSFGLWFLNNVGKETRQLEKYS
jgi:hypothetical protein